MSTFWIVRFREPFLFLFAGREVRLPSRRRALLAWGGGYCLDFSFLGFFFSRLLLCSPLAISASFGRRRVRACLLWLTTGYHLQAMMLVYC